MCPSIEAFLTKKKKSIEVIRYRGGRRVLDEIKGIGFQFGDWL